MQVMPVFQNVASGAFMLAYNLRAATGPRPSDRGDILFRKTGNRGNLKACFGEGFRAGCAPFQLGGEMSLGRLATGVIASKAKRPASP